jgi:predicted TIM-barrel fold metal-dependent hydrolase
VVDAFVTPVLWPAGQAPEYVSEMLSSVFGRDPSEVLARRTPEELIAEMDRAGVEVAILNALPGRADDVAEFVRAYPHRFVLSGEVDPRRGIAAVREVRALVADYGLALVRLVPFQIGLPPNHGAYFPVFAACVELGIPVSLTTGMPAVAMPAEPQRPLHLDEVCRFFPELVVLMAHGAGPWWDEAIAMMARFPNLYLMTSDWAPRRLPPSLLSYMRGRGRDKVLFATGFPTLPFGRCVDEATALDLPLDALEAYLHGNARRIFALHTRITEEG